MNSVARCTFLLLALVLISNLPVRAQINASMDVAVFRYDSTQVYTEIYYSVPVAGLTFSSKGDSLQADVKVQIDYAVRRLCLETSQLLSTKAMEIYKTKKHLKYGDWIGIIADKKQKEVAQIGSVFLKQDIDVMEKVLTEPPDRIKTAELFPKIEDFDRIQNYMTDQVSVLSGKIDMTKFVDTRFAESAGAK